jgi:FkbM family methyltransferase
MKIGIITPIGPGHKETYESCKKSINDAWIVSKGCFSNLELIPMLDLDGKYGRSQRRNDGIQIAENKNCDWIFFIDADDLMSPSAFYDVTPYIQNYDAIWGNICEMPFGDLAQIKLRENQLVNTENFSEILKVDPFLTLQMGHFVKTSIAKEIGFDESMNVGEDFKYYLQLCAKFKFIKCPCIFFINQRGNHSIGPASGNGKLWREVVQLEIQKTINRHPVTAKVYLEHKESLFYITNPFDIIQAHQCRGLFFEQQELISLKKYVGEKKIIAEIGANIGNHTIFYAHHMNPTKIIPFETNPKSIEILRKNLMLNTFNVEIDERGIGIGLGSINQNYTIQQDDPNNLVAAKLIKSTGSVDPVQVKIFDEVMGDHKVDFMKIDVEGMEFEVLKGASESILRNKPLIYIEVWKQSIPKLEDWIKTFNYEQIGYTEMTYAVNFLLAPKV